MRHLMFGGRWDHAFSMAGLQECRPDEEGHDVSAYIRLDPLVPIGRTKAWILVLCGPGDRCANPLTGTRYDPVVRERIKVSRHHARVVRRELRRMGRPAMGTSISAETTARMCRPPNAEGPPPSELTIAAVPRGPAQRSRWSAPGKLSGGV